MLLLVLLLLVASSLAAVLFEFDFCRNRPNGNFPHPDFPSCSSLFLRCWEEETIPERCRVPGQRFDIRFRKCQPKEAVDACKPVTPAPAPPSTPPPEFTCMGRPNGNYKIPGSGCTDKFFRCWEGQRFEVSCRIASFRVLGPDGGLAQCVPISKVPDCLPPTPPAPPSTEPPFTCKGRRNGDYKLPNGGCTNKFVTCWEGQRFERTCVPPTWRFEGEDGQLGRCLPASKVSECRPPAPPSTEPPFSCKGRRNGNYPNPSAEPCTNEFIRCWEGQLIDSTCRPSTWRFSSDLSRCLPEKLVSKCSPPVAPAPPVLPPKKPFIVEVDEFDCSILKDGGYADKKEPCSPWFWMCSGGAATRQDCAGKTFFDEESMSCLKKQYVKACGGTPTQKAEPVTKPPIKLRPIDFDCTSEFDGFYGNPQEECSSFYVGCSGGKKSVMACPITLKFDSVSRMCIEKQFNKWCGGTPTTTTEAPPRRPPITDIDCSDKPEGAFFPNPKQPCSKDYYTCVGGILQELWCPARLQYDVETNMCLHKLYIRACGGTPTPRPTTPLPAPPSTFIPPKKMVFDCFGRESGLFEDPENPCSPVYYKCFRGLAKKLVCPSPATQRFDLLSGRCLPKNLVLWCKF